MTASVLRRNSLQLMPSPLQALAELVGEMVGEGMGSPGSVGASSEMHGIGEVIPGLSGAQRAMEATNGLQDALLQLVVKAVAADLGVAFSDTAEEVQEVADNVPEVEWVEGEAPGMHERAPEGAAAQEVASASSGQPHESPDDSGEAQDRTAGGTPESDPASSVSEAASSSGQSNYSESFEELEQETEEPKPSTFVQPPATSTPLLLPCQSPHAAIPLAKRLPPPPALDSLDFALSADEIADTPGGNRPGSPATPGTPDDVSSSLMALANAPRLGLAGLSRARRAADERRQVSAPGSDAESLARPEEVAPPPWTAISRPPALPEPGKHRLWRAGEKVKHVVHLGAGADSLATSSASFSSASISCSDGMFATCLFATSIVAHFESFFAPSNRRFV